MSLNVGNTAGKVIAPKPVPALATAAPAAAVAPVAAANRSRLGGEGPRHASAVAHGVLSMVADLQSAASEDAGRLAVRRRRRPQPPPFEAEPAPLAPAPRPTAEQIATPPIVGMVREQLADRHGRAPAAAAPVELGLPVEPPRAAVPAASLKTLIEAQAALTLLQAGQLSLGLRPTGSPYGMARSFLWGF